MILLTFRLVPYSAIALWPFILVKQKLLKENQVLINHERIHLRQQLEMLILPFYLVYGIHYVINLIKFSNHDEAYRNIVFEKEAYMNDWNLNYLNKRKFWHWMRYW